MIISNLVVSLRLLTHSECKQKKMTNTFRTEVNQLLVCRLDKNATFIMMKLTLLHLSRAATMCKALWTFRQWLLAWSHTDQQCAEVLFSPNSIPVLGLRAFWNKTNFCFSNTGSSPTFISSHAHISWGQSNLNLGNEKSWSKLQTEKTWSYLA